MVGHSKIVEISRNVPPIGTSTPASEIEDEMITAIKRDDDATSEGFLPSDPLPYDTEIASEYEYDTEVAPRRWGPILAGSTLVIMFAAWTGFWGWANQAELLRFDNPARLGELIGLWVVPVSLLALLWLLAMRMSTTETRRFGDVAALLRTESEKLETRIQTVNGEIAMARSFLAENARELESVGRVSAAKLTEAAQQLVTALADADQKAKMLESASSAAVNNVELLRNHLPVVTSAAKDATNQIGNVGNAAGTQIESLIGALRVMDQTFESTSAAMTSLEKQTSETSLNIGNAAKDAGSILHNSTTDSEQRVSAMLQLLKTETTNVEQRIGEASENINALGESNSQLLAEQVSELANAVNEVREATNSQDTQLSSIISKLKSSLDESAQQLSDLDERASARLTELATNVGATINDCDARLKAVDTNATDRVAKLAFAISALSESSSELAVNLSANENQTAAVLSNAEKLAATMSAVSAEMNGDIPIAFEQLQRRLAESNQALSSLRAESNALDQQSVSLVDRMSGLDAVIEGQRSSVDALLATSETSLTERRDEIAALAVELKDTQKLIGEVATTAEDQLSGSLRRVADAAREAANSSKAIVEAELADIGERLTEQNRTLLAGAIDAQLADVGLAVKAAIDRNISLSEQATQRVTAQLQSVTELTTNLEQRAAHAREQFDGIDDEAFARRIALLTESLNSASIDVAKILSNEVTDTAWAAYLKGDRGVFTRRAVRLLDNGEARIIANHYDDEPEFRDHVNRYIHDFESMMRVLLSTRDGNAIGVTLLSSDVGKLYVALAQAIDRLRS
jgi:archaellum component FlaC